MGTPIVFISHKNGCLRFCVNDCRLNLVTDCNSYRVPCMDERIYVLGEANMFSTTESPSGYCLILMDKKDIDKPALVTHHRLLEYTRMMFGLKDVPVMFHHAMNVISAIGRWQHDIKHNFNGNINYQNGPKWQNLYLCTYKLNLFYTSWKKMK